MPPGGVSSVAVAGDEFDATADEEWHHQQARFWLPARMPGLVSRELGPVGAVKWKSCGIEPKPCPLVVSLV